MNEQWLSAATRKITMFPMTGEGLRRVAAGVFGERSRIVALHDGTLMGFLVANIDGDQAVLTRSSGDNGYTWSEPQILFKLDKEVGGWGGPDVLVDRDGELHLFFLNDAHTGIIDTGEDQRVRAREMGQQRLDIWHSRSINGRESWQSPKPIWQGYTGSLNSVIQLRNGRIVLPFSYRTSRHWADRGEGLDAFTFMGQYNSTVVYSDDNGDTWHLGSDVKVVVPDIVSAYGAVEPVVLELEDGRVWMVIRTQLGRLYESFSEDGAIWSRSRPTRFLSSDSPVGLVRLKDGRMVILWNNCLRFPYAYGGRHVLHAAISDDGGESWHGYRGVARDPYRNEPPPPRGDHGTAYPFPTVTKDDKVLFCTGQGQGRDLIMLLNPEYLYETFQKEDFSTGLEEWSVFGTKGVELVPHPSKGGKQVLSIRKVDPDFPAAAVWNFPLGVRGSLRIRLLLQPESYGCNLGITDHFSVPFDEEDRLNNLYNLPINLDDEVANGVKLEPGRWYNLQLDWDCIKRDCQVALDGRQVIVLPLRRESEGASYLRLSSMAEQTEQGGTLVESVEVDVS